MGTPKLDSSQAVVLVPRQPISTEEWLSLIERRASLVKRYLKIFTAGSFLDSFDDPPSLEDLWPKNSTYPVSTQMIHRGFKWDVLNHIYPSVGLTRGGDWVSILVENDSPYHNDVRSITVRPTSIVEIIEEGLAKPQEIFVWLGEEVYRWEHGLEAKYQDLRSHAEGLRVEDEIVKLRHRNS